jgi:hypothetical protein
MEFKIDIKANYYWLTIDTPNNMDETEKEPT